MLDEDAISIVHIIAKCGGATVLGNAYTPPISKQAISQWAVVPAERVLVAARLSGYSPTEIRPDIYPINWLTEENKAG